MNEKKLKKMLEEIQSKPPRMGVYPGRIHKDKSKYTRKKKHKKDVND